MTKQAPGPVFDDDQHLTVFQNIPATVAKSVSFTIWKRIKQGSIQLDISSDYVGTTATAQLFGSNNNVKFFPVLADDDTTAVLFTFTTASDSRAINIKRRLYQFYRLDFVPGDASAGTISAEFVGSI